MDADDVVAGPADDGVDPGAALEAVVGAVVAFDEKGVVAAAAAQGIDPEAADDEVVAGAAADGVVAGAGVDAFDVEKRRAAQVDGVVGGVAGDAVDPGAAIDNLYRLLAAEEMDADDVVAGAADDGVDPGTALEAVVGAVVALDQKGVVAAAAAQGIDPEPADDEVMAGAAVEGIVAPLAIEGILAVGAGQSVVGTVPLKDRDRGGGDGQPGHRRYAAGCVGDGVTERDRAAETTGGSIDPAAVAIVGQGAIIGAQAGNGQGIAVGVRGGGEELCGGDGQAAVLGQAPEIDRRGDHRRVVARDGQCHQRRRVEYGAVGEDDALDGEFVGTVEDPDAVALVAVADDQVLAVDGDAQRGRIDPGAEVDGFVGIGTAEDRIEAVPQIEGITAVILSIDIEKVVPLAADIQHLAGAAVGNHIVAGATDNQHLAVLDDLLRFGCRWRQEQAALTGDDLVMAEDAAVGEAVVLDDAALPPIDGNGVSAVADHDPEGGGVVARIGHFEADVVGSDPGAKGDGVAAAKIDQNVAAVAAIEDIGRLTPSADQEVIAGAAGEGVIPPLAVDGVDASCADQDIVGNVPLDDYSGAIEGDGLRQQRRTIQHRAVGENDSIEEFGICAIVYPEAVPLVTIADDQIMEGISVRITVGFVVTGVDVGGISVDGDA